MWLNKGRRRLKIGTRLTLCFAGIVLLMAAGYAVALWQFHALRIQEQDLDGAYQKSAAVLSLNSHLFAFRDKLQDLTETKNGSQFVRDAALLRRSMLNDVEETKRALNGPTPYIARDPFLLDSLDVIASALPVQIDAMSDLAKAGDWPAIRLRSENQVRQLSYLTVSLVDKVAAEVAAERARVLSNTQIEERRAFVALLGACFITLLVAGALGAAVTRSITHPLVKLDTGAQAMARGDFLHQVAVAGNDELTDLGNAFNHTARQLRELYETLQASEARFRSSEAFLAEGEALSHTGSWAWKIPTREITWSSEHFRILGYDPGKPKPSLGTFWRRIHPDDRSRLRQILERAERTDVETEFRIVLPDRSIRYIHGVSHAVINESGQLAELIGTSMDITGRKHAQDALQQAQAELAHVARVATMGELTASIAHEVSQPLTAIVVNASAGMHWLAAAPPNLEGVREALGRIGKDGHWAGTVIARIRGLVKKTAPATERFDLNETILEVIALAGSELRGKGVSLETRLSNDLPRVLGDRVQLQQVILNLIVNAIEAMCGVDGPRDLLVKSEKDGSAGVIIAVRDSGPGLDPANLHYLFEAFYTTKSKGMGMGLAISRSIVEAHGGRLSGIPNSGRGATFQITLPAGEARASAVVLSHQASILA